MSVDILVARKLGILHERRRQLKAQLNQIASERRTLLAVYFNRQKEINSK